MTKYLVFGDGLLGNTFKLVMPSKVAVLPKTICDVTNKDDIVDAINYYHPKVVINATGIVPKHPASIEETFKVNSFAPHYIADVCFRRCYFIHLSTDCVFSGKRGNYTEKFKPDATDIYGMSKVFGEPSSGLTVRTSFIGLPDPKGRGLLAWAEQQPEIIGYNKVFWNGVTTYELVQKLLEYEETGITGLRHVYSYTVSKYELLKLAKEVYGWTMPLYKESDIVDSSTVSDKTLNSLYATGFVAKPLKRQLKEMQHALN